MSAGKKFPYHLSVAPMMWVLFALSLIELFVVHLFVALKWPVIGWTLTTLSALGAVWLVWWIMSFKRLPHELRNGRLILKLGTIKRLEVELSNIASAKSQWEQGALDRKNIVNFAGIAHPNRCLELKEPVAKGRAKGKHRIFIRLDDAAAFDQAMLEHGVEIV